MCVFLFNKHVLSMLQRKFKHFAHMSEFIYTYSTISHTSLKNWTVWRRMIYRNCSSGIVFRSSSMLPLSRPTADHESIGTRPSPSFAGYWPIIWWRSSRTVQDPPLDLQGIDRLYDGALAAWYIGTRPSLFMNTGTFCQCFGSGLFSGSGSNFFSCVQIGIGRKSGSDLEKS